MATNATTPLSFSTGRLPRNSKLPPPGAASPRATSGTALRGAAAGPEPRAGAADEGCGVAAGARSEDRVEPFAVAGGIAGHHEDRSRRAARIGAKKQDADDRDSDDRHRRKALRPRRLDRQSMPALDPAPGFAAATGRFPTV